MATAFIRACEERGIPPNADVNGEKQEGAGWFQYTMKKAKRQSVARSFLAPALDRKNLTVITGAFCKRITFDRDRATGIEFMTAHSATLTARAQREVILCAGAFESPKLLMLSGVGEKAQLGRYGIELVKDLPGVGKNLQDHLFYPVSSLCKKPISNNHYLPLHQQAAALIQYLLFKNGPLSIGPLEAVAFLKSAAGLNRPDVQFQFTPTNAGAEGRTANMYDMSTFPRQDGYTILPTQVRPKSRGYVALASANGNDAPVIQPNYLAEEEDRLVMIKAGKKALEVLETSAFESLRITTHLPTKRNSDDEWLRHIEQTAECVYHPVGTCKMGKDEMAVVDSQLRVHGIEKLRVVDASVMPTITSGNTNAPVIMIAEKAADMIKETWL
jgi:choline dehydrogenase